MSIADGIRERPARDLAHASELFAALSARDGVEISAAGRSRFYPCDDRSDIAVVLLHGFTNCPQQWVPFAEGLHRDGVAVVIPRYPGHGYADRRTKAPMHVSAGDLLATASDAIDIAAGAGKRIVVSGLSIGGAMSVWLTMLRSDVSLAVPIVPMVGLPKMGAHANAFLASALSVLPNFFIPWDPSGKDDLIPTYAYTHFPTHLLAQCIDVGLAVFDEALIRAPRGDVRMLLNANEPAVNNDLALELCRRLQRDRPGAGACEIIDGLPANHDIIDPTNPEARTDLVYPRVRALIESLRTSASASATV